MLLMIRLVIQRISSLQISVRVQLLAQVFSSFGPQLSSHRHKTFPGPRNISSGRSDADVESGERWRCLVFTGAREQRGKNADPGDLSLTDFITQQRVTVTRESEQTELQS